jgi:RNA polymerase sigma factor (sigma-70 family)
MSEIRVSEDQQLLHEYAAGGSRKALGELIRRHLALVYSAALRQVRDSHLAEDVTQAVFLVLSEKASTIRSGVAVGGWLLSVTRFASVNAMKKRVIQKKHESLAARPEKIHADVDAGHGDEWVQIEPLLDEELNRLAVVDRDAIVLRFFQDRSFAQIGAELGLSEDAARKRVGRSLERLRSALRRREPSISLAALSGAIATHAVQAAPSHLMAGTIAAGISSPSSQCLSISKGATKMIAWTKAKLVSSVAASLMATGTGAVVVAHHMAQRPAASISTVEYSAPAAAPGAAPAPVATNDGVGTINTNDASVFTPPAPANAPADDAAPAAAPAQTAVGGGATSGFLELPAQGMGSVMILNGNAGGANANAPVFPPAPGVPGTQNDGSSRGQ